MLSAGLSLPGRQPGEVWSSMEMEKKNEELKHIEKETVMEGRHIKILWGDFI